MSLSGRSWIFGASLLLLACGPNVQGATLEPPPIAPPDPSPQNEAKPASTACGMPEGIAEPDWPRTLTKTSRDEQPRFVPGSTTLAILPDTQYYAKCRSAHFEKQSAWVNQERNARNIRAVVSLGDLTESNTAAEWLFVQRSLAPLDRSLPVLLTTGNHDYGDGGTANRRSTLFPEYFGPNYAQRSGVQVEIMPNSSIENAFYSIDLGEVQLGILLLEWSPREKAVSWAHEVLSRHPKHRTIVVTHAYLYYDGTRYDYAKYGDAQKWNPLAYKTAQGDESQHRPHDGEMLWQALVRKHPGIFLTLNGHVLGDGSALLTSTGDHGNTVHQMLANYQMLDEGGLGYLRLLELLPDGRTLRVKTYSPSLELFATAEDQSFTLNLDPPLWPSKK